LKVRESQGIYFGKSATNPVEASCFYNLNKLVFI